VRVEDGRIVSLDPVADDVSLPWIAPGLVDAQVNGFAGVDFNRSGADAAAWTRVCDGLYAHGVTAFLATFISHEREVYRTLLREWQAQRAVSPGNCAGFHMEGPFLNPSPDTHGVHDPALMCGANVAWLDEWQAATSRGVRVVTLAPEYEGVKAGVFISRAVRDGVRVSIGHAMPSALELEYAVDAGATAWTHLGNACARTMPRFDNPLFHAMAEERMRCFLIPDAVHMPHYAFRVCARALGGRLLLTTDAMSGAGAGPGTFTLGRVEVNVGRDGVARDPGSGRLAGSTVTPFAGVFLAARMSGLPWASMWDAFSTEPARWLGVESGLTAGGPADFCVFTTAPAPRLLRTVHAGEVRFEAGG
jgi:N-acetylglucosamine-6-phosphate deacetylase